MQNPLGGGRVQGLVLVAGEVAEAYADVASPWPAFSVTKTPWRSRCWPPPAVAILAEAPAERELDEAAVALLERWIGG